MNVVDLNRNKCGVNVWFISHCSQIFSFSLLYTLRGESASYLERRKACNAIITILCDHRIRYLTLSSSRWFDLRCYYANYYYCKYFSGIFSCCTNEHPPCSEKKERSRLTRNENCTEKTKISFHFHNKKNTKYLLLKIIWAFGVVCSQNFALFVSNENQAHSCFYIFIVSIKMLCYSANIEIVQHFYALDLQLENFYDAIISSRDTVRNSNSHWWVTLSEQSVSMVWSRAS